VALLRPKALDDPLAARMAALLDSSALSGGEKQQVAFTLAMVGLRDGMELPESVELSPEAKQLLASMRALALAGAARSSPGGMQ
jgi:hypothetical protein